MSDTNNTGGPAFPYEYEVPDHGYSRDMEAKNWRRVAAPGMSLRDYFAAKAMHALMANPNNGPSLDFAKYAYAYADLMLKAREQ